MQYQTNEQIKHMAKWNVYLGNQQGPIQGHERGQEDPKGKHRQYVCHYTASKTRSSYYEWCEIRHILMSTQMLMLTEPQKLMIEDTTIVAPFLYSPESTVNLLGRDLLCRLAKRKYTAAPQDIVTSINTVY